MTKPFRSKLLRFFSSDDEYDIDALLAGGDDDDDDDFGASSFFGDQGGDGDESGMAIHEKLPPFANEENRRLHSEVCTKGLSFEIYSYVVQNTSALNLDN